MPVYTTSIIILRSSIHISILRFLCRFYNKRSVLELNRLSHQKTYELFGILTVFLFPSFIL